MDESKYLHKLHVTNCGPQKLGFVKLIKDYTGYGLKESKDIVDTWQGMHHGSYSPAHLELDRSLVLQLTATQALILDRELTKLGVAFTLDGRKHLRDEKLTALGIIAEDDMRNLGILHDVKALKAAVLNDNDDYILSWIKNGFRGWNKLSDEEVKEEFKKRI